MEEKLIFDTESKKLKITQEYEILKLVPETDPILSKVMPKYVFGDAVKTDKLLGDLITTCKHYNGFGLAANQCGIETSIIVVGFAENYWCLINPEIVYQSTETSMNMEGCLSFPGLVLSVDRPKEIIVKYQNSLGEEKKETYVGLTARIIQHEINHLNGITFIDKVKPLALKMGLKKRDKNFKKAAREIVNQIR
jgi:peptide deformylase